MENFMFKFLMKFIVLMVATLSLIVFIGCHEKVCQCQCGCGEVCHCKNDGSCCNNTNCCKGTCCKAQCHE